MPTQTLIFVALPNGRDGKDKLKLSLYLTPRLDAGATLGDFPDILNWTQQVQNKGLKFEIKCGTKKATVSADKAVLRPDIWKAIFTPTTLVQAYEFTDYSKQLVVSYPTRQALSFLKFATQSVGVPRFTNEQRGSPLDVLNPLNYRDDGESSLEDELNAMRARTLEEPAGCGGADRRRAAASSADEQSRRHCDDN